MIEPLQKKIVGIGLGKMYYEMGKPLPALLALGVAWALLNGTRFDECWEGTQVSAGSQPRSHCVFSILHPRVLLIAKSTSRTKTPGSEVGQSPMSKTWLVDNQVRTIKSIKLFKRLFT